MTDMPSMPMENHIAKELTRLHQEIARLAAILNRNVDYIGDKDRDIITRLNALIRSELGDLVLGVATQARAEILDRHLENERLRELLSIAVDWWDEHGGLRDPEWVEDARRIVK